MDLKGKKVLVAGTGVSGIASALLLLDAGADTILYDGSEKLCAEDIHAKSEKLSGVPVLLGTAGTEQICRECHKATQGKAPFDFVVLSPGVPVDLPVVKTLKESGAAVWGEIELAYRCAKGRLAAITGTNGKTTTTALAGEILKSYFADVKVVGNIGIPYTSLAAQMTDDTVTAAEISSFQLETADTFCPDVSAILNITPDHLNRHHTMECYIAVKESITKNQKPGQVCVLNYEDEALRAFGETISDHLNVIYFSSKQRLERGMYLEGNCIYWAGENEVKAVVDTGELNLLGTHNYENVMAAAAVTHSLGVPFEKIREVLKTFRAVAHRIEYVEEIAGVRYYNDSKATNPDAAIQGIRAMERPTWLIGGGYDKQSGYGEWIDAFEGKVEKLVLIGATKEKIANEAAEKGFTDVVMCESLEEAVAYCHSHAREGDAVLLSPACASWDMFANYEKRGDLFKELVRGYRQ
ncbi:MAG: UDP-N-acetylmuramoyl-L-alanine--D-glutamate ligase [Eubacterium sp.]|nr:UDP-N-acetylmuramoyl-L-alanine--D-glutamate ligase [Eubacterium sp.]